MQSSYLALRFATLADAFARKSELVFVDVMTDQTENVYPMIPGGKGITEMILAEELPMIYTVSPFCFAAIRSDIGNVRGSTLAPYRVTWNIEELYFKKP